jgi:alpha-tubulin suppressor-like RCC1 family protein
MNRALQLGLLVATVATAGLNAACGSDAGSPSGDAGQDQGTAGDGTTSDAPGAADGLVSDGAEGSVSDGSGDATEESIADGGPGNDQDSAVEAEAGAAGPIISAAGYATCVLRSGAMKCWGDNTWGELGDGTHSPTHAPHPTPTSVLFASPTAVAVGYGFGCAFDGARTACWGANRYDNLGHDRALDVADGGDAGLCSGNPCSPAAVDVAGLANVTAIGLGGDFSCAQLADRSVSCWGENTYGELGFAPVDGGMMCGTDWCSPTPTPIGISQVSSLSAGGEFACVRRTDGSVWCWGDDTQGELGFATSDAGADASPVDRTPHPTPVQVQGLGSTLAVASGSAFACALLADSTVSCWGDNYYGELGHDPGVDSRGGPWFFSPVPSAVPGLTGVRELALGDGFACAVKSDDTVACWGTNYNGNLGHDPGTDTDKDFGGYPIRPAPTAVAGLSNVLHIAAGEAHVCALEKDDTVWCWGGDYYGEIGVAPPDGGRQVNFAPVEVMGL